MSTNPSSERVLAAEANNESCWHVSLDIPAGFNSPGWIDTAEARTFIHKCQDLLRDPTTKLLTFKPSFSREWFPHRDTLRHILPPSTRGNDQMLMFPSRDECKRSLEKRLAISAATPMAPLADAMLEDATTLALLFEKITGGSPIFPAICVLSGDQIDPQQGVIHADLPILTMVCTFSGATTEYTPPENVLGYHYQWIGRWPYWLKAYDLAEQNDFRLLGESTVGILKGERSASDPREFVRTVVEEQSGETFNVDRGLVHRAPLLFPGDRRIYFQVYSHQIPQFLRVGAPRAVFDV